jgi:peptide/nickel transport system substrate-binding protein
MKLRTALLGAAAAVAFAPAAFAERGADGNVKILYSQAVSIMNAYLSSGTKDVEVGSLVLEPLAGFDQDGKSSRVWLMAFPAWKMARSPRITPRSPGS